MNYPRRAASVGLGEAGGQGAHAAGNPQPGAGDGGPALGLAADAGGRDGGAAAASPSGMGFLRVWSVVPAPFLALIWEKPNWDTSNPVRAEGRRARQRGRIPPEHHRRHGLPRRRHPSDSVTQFPAGSFPHRDTYF